MDPEAELLRDFLDQQRNHVLGILEGLTGRPPVSPLPGRGTLIDRRPVSGPCGTMGR